MLALVAGGGLDLERVTVLAVLEPRGHFAAIMAAAS
jgi:hypothetical protein